MSSFLILMVCLGFAMGGCLAFIIYAKIKLGKEDREYAKFLRDERWKWVSLNSQTGKEKKVTPGFSWQADSSISDLIMKPFPDDYEDDQDDSDFLLDSMSDDDEEFPVPQDSHVANYNPIHVTNWSAAEANAPQFIQCVYKDANGNTQLWNIAEGNVVYCYDKKRDIYGKIASIVKIFPYSSTVLIQEAASGMEKPPVHMFQKDEIKNLRPDPPPVEPKKDEPEPWEFLDTK